MKYIIPTIILSLVLLSCKSDEEESTNNTLTCTGTSSGSGPTIGSVTLEEATYLSTCFSSKNIKLEFKNSTSAQFTTYTYGDTSCSGTATDESTACMESITVSSTAVTKPTLVDGAAGANATGYNASNTWKHSSDTGYLQFSGVSSSVFWYNQSSSQAGLDSNAFWLFKFTKQ